MHRFLTSAVLLGIAAGSVPAQSLVQQIPSRLRQYAATYEVRLSYTGYVGLVEGAPNCIVSNLGSDVMIGTLTGVEIPTATDEDVVYTGVLTRTTRIDFCETKPGRSPDEPVWCTATLDGTAVMEVELSVYGESERGAFMKTAPGIGPATVNVGGTCDQQVTQQVRSDYPTGDDGGGASPNGQEIGWAGTIATGGRTRLFNGGVARLRPGKYPPPPPNPSKGWTLEVIRRIP